MRSDPLKAAAADVGSARREIEVCGSSGIPAARALIERAIALLAPATGDHDLPAAVRDAALRLRVVLASHVLAVDDLEAVGIGRATVASVLYRAADSSELDAAMRDAFVSNRS